MALEGGVGYFLLTEVYDVQNTYENNFGHKGGAIYSQQSTVTVEGSSFKGNGASEGGAIFAQSSSNLYLSENSIFYQNKATSQGGAIKLAN